MAPNSNLKTFILVENKWSLLTLSSVMNKATIQRFCVEQGWTCSYSGKKGGGMYINPLNTGMSLDDIEVAIAQRHGVLPDFKLFIA